MGRFDLTNYSIKTDLFHTQKNIQNKLKFLREKNNALEAFIYKASRASKKAAINLSAFLVYFSLIFSSEFHSLALGWPCFLKPSSPAQQVR